MDESVWKVIRLAIRTADTSIPRVGRRPRYGDQLIVGMCFWAAAHDRPLCWACGRLSYNRLMRSEECAGATDLSAAMSAGHRLGVGRPAPDHAASRR